ncbi:MAG: hypothetical protein ACJAS4_003872 [Bacteriovoracaceae bacterium]|jgi:hypothetical protein
MKKLLFGLTLLTSISSYAGMRCTGDKLGLSFESEGPQYTFSGQILANGSVSEVEVNLLQAYEGSSHFMAKIVLDGQYMDIQTSFKRKVGEYSEYAGSIFVNGKPFGITCIQE